MLTLQNKMRSHEGQNMISKNYSIQNSEGNQNLPSKQSKYLFKDQSVYQQEDAVTADPYMDASRNSGDKFIKKHTKRSGSQSKSATKQNFSQFKQSSGKRSRGSSARQKSPRFQSSKKMKRELSTRSPINKHAAIGASSKLIQQMSSVCCGLGGQSQISSQYLGSNRNRQKHFAKADNYNIRQVAKRSNIPMDQQKSYISKKKVKVTPCTSAQKSKIQLPSELASVQGAAQKLKENYPQIYDIETLDYEDVSIYTRGPMDNQSINVNSELMIHDSANQFAAGISPRKFEGNKTVIGANKKTVLVTGNDVVSGIGVNLLSNKGSSKMKLCKSGVLAMSPNQHPAKPSPKKKKNGASKSPKAEICYPKNGSRPLSRRKGQHYIKQGRTSVSLLKNNNGGGNKVQQNLNQSELACASVPDRKMNTKNQRIMNTDNRPPKKSSEFGHSPPMSSFVADGNQMRQSSKKRKNSRGGNSMLELEDDSDTSNIELRCKKVGQHEYNKYMVSGTENAKKGGYKPTKFVKSPIHPKLNSSSSSNRLFKGYYPSAVVGIKKTKTPELPLTTTGARKKTNQPHQNQSALFGNLNGSLKIVNTQKQNNVYVQQINENIEQESSQETLDLANKINVDTKKKTLPSQTHTPMNLLQKNKRNPNDRDVLSKYISHHVKQNLVNCGNKIKNCDRTTLAIDTTGRKRLLTGKKPDTSAANQTQIVPKLCHDDSEYTAKLVDTIEQAIDDQRQAVGKKRRSTAVTQQYQNDVSIDVKVKPVSHRKVGLGYQKSTKNLIGTRTANLGGSDGGAQAVKTPRMAPTLSIIDADKSAQPQIYSCSNKPGGQNGTESKKNAMQFQSEQGTTAQGSSAYAVVRKQMGVGADGDPREKKGKQQQYGNGQSVLSPRKKGIQIETATKSPKLRSPRMQGTNNFEKKLSLKKLDTQQKMTPTCSTSNNGVSKTQQGYRRTTMATATNPGYMSTSSNRLVQINQDSLHAKLKMALGSSKVAATEFRNSEETELKFVQILMEKQQQSKSKKSAAKPNEYQVNYQIYSSSNSNVNGMPERPGTGMQIRKISSTSKNMAAPYSFFSQTSTGQQSACFGKSSQLTVFPGSLNYTNLTDYSQGVILGQGAYATVKQATHKQSGMVVAIKIYDKFKLSSNAQVKKSVSREIRLLALLSNTSRPADEKRGQGEDVGSVSMVDGCYNEVLAANAGRSFGMGHPNIMRLYDAIDTQKQLYLVMENVQGSILQDVLKSSPCRMLNERVAAKIFGQIIEALRCFHEIHIAHRDLKPDNIMVDMSDPTNPVTKVIDFGFAAQSVNKMQIFCGTPAYMSPEICAKQSYNGPASDIWAAGVILFTMLFGYQPFKAPSEKELYKKIIKGNFIMPSTSNIPCEGRIFTESMTESPSMSGALRSPQALKAPQTLLQQLMEKNTKANFAVSKKTATTAAVNLGSNGTINTQEVFENYPLIQNASTIKALLYDMLNPQEQKRASAKTIQEKYSEWLSGDF